MTELTILPDELAEFTLDQFTVIQAQLDEGARKIRQHLAILGRPWKAGKGLTLRPFLGIFLLPAEEQLAEVVGFLGEKIFTLGTCPLAVCLIRADTRDGGPILTALTQSLTGQALLATSNLCNIRGHLRLGKRRLTAAAEAPALEAFWAGHWKAIERAEAAQIERTKP